MSRGWFNRLLLPGFVFQFRGCSSTWPWRPTAPPFVDRAVPALSLLDLLDARWFLIVYQVMLFGTLVETGTGMWAVERLSG